MSVECRKKAMDLLALRSHFRKELAAKLRRRFDPEEIEEVLDGLARDGLMDEATTAREFVTQRSKRNLGPRRLRAEMVQRGVDEQLATEVIEDLQIDEGELAEEAAQRWLRSRSKAPDRRALARHLERRGFAQRVIVSILERLPDDLGASDQDGAGGARGTPAAEHPEVATNESGSDTQ